MGFCNILSSFFTFNFDFFNVALFLSEVHELEFRSWQFGRFPYPFGMYNYINSYIEPVFVD